MKGDSRFFFFLIEAWITCIVCLLHVGLGPGREWGLLNKWETESLWLFERVGQQWQVVQRAVILGRTELTRGETRACVISNSESFALDYVFCHPQSQQLVPRGTWKGNPERDSDQRSLLSCKNSLSSFHNTVYSICKSPKMFVYFFSLPNH